jgi:hypothetical protein
MCAERVSADRRGDFLLGALGTHAERTRKTGMVLHEQRPDTLVVEHVRARPEASQQSVLASRSNSKMETSLLTR